MSPKIKELGNWYVICEPVNWRLLINSKMYIVAVWFYDFVPCKFPTIMSPRSFNKEEYIV